MAHGVFKVKNKQPIEMLRSRREERLSSKRNGGGYKREKVREELRHVVVHFPKEVHESY